MSAADGASNRIERALVRAHSPRVRRGPMMWRWLGDALPFAIFALAYESLGLARSLVVTRGVHVFWPYWFDKTVFGVGGLGQRRSLNEVFATHHWPFVDFLTGLSYLLYIHVVVAFAVFLALVDRTEAGAQRVRALGWTFALMNVASFVTYLLYPVAPPWYVAAHGFGPVLADATSSPAALSRWDDLTGVPYFQHFYSHASDVFGAMPSMHCAYPMLLLLYSFELRRPRLTVALAAFQLFMCFSAVYLQHHYVSDVIGGIAFAVVAYWLEREFGGRAAPAPASATAIGGGDRA
jgi:inositol phosphorylceramide synthase catalytic subunit